MPGVRAFGLFYPWRPVRAPQGRRLSMGSQTWAALHGLFDQKAALAHKFAAVEVGSLAALVYPGAPLSAQQTLADFLGWVFLEDDIFDEEDADSTDALARVLHAFSAVFDGSVDPPADASPALVALADVRRRLQALAATPASYARFAASMRAFWIDGVLEEARVRKAPALPSLAEYLELRMISVGALPCFDLIELAYGFALPADAVADPEVVEVRRLGTLEIALTNDLFSYEKELRAGDPLNLVHLLMHHHAIGFDEAVARAVAVHNDVVSRFDEVARGVEQRSPALRVYVEGHRRWMRGAHDWQLEARRYRAPPPPQQQQQQQQPSSSPAAAVQAA